MLENNSPIYAAINNIVNLFELNDKACIFSYKNEKDFEYLWELLDANSTRSGELSKTFIIVWDGIPAREGQSDFVGTSKYLTPMDWAVGFSLSVISSVNKGIISSPDSRIFIFDLTSHLYPDADSLKIVEQFPKRTMKNLPWVRIFSPGDCAKTFNVDNFIKSIVGNKEDKENLVPSIRDCKEGKPDLDILKNIWASILTRPSSPGDHHAIANLVGPLLLMGENIGEDQHSKALRSLMTALGLIPKEAKREDFPWIKWDAEPWKDRLSRLTKDKEKLNLILIDDQYTQGWGEVLCKAVGAEYDQAKVPIWKNEARHLTVKAFDSANSLVKRLKELDANNLDQRFRFRIDESDKDEKISEILFLDLRLFSGRSFDDEIKFFEDLIGIGREILKKEKEGKVLPWPSFDEEKEFKRVEKWFGKKGKKREDDEYIVALTFLPRIISLTDLSLPIVIFSSTGRRNIAETLKGYGNIITDFDKPKFTVDMPEDIAGQTKRKFEEALAKAMGCLAIRKHLNDLFEECKASIPNITVSTNDLFAALYIDESGDGSADSPLVLGGIMAVGNNRDQLESFENSLRKIPPNWTKGGGLPKMCTTMMEYQNNGNTIMARAKKSGVKLYGIALCQSSYDGVIPPDMLLDDSVLDNLHRNIMRTLIEVVVSYVVPNIAGDKVLHLSVFTDVRSIPVDGMMKHEPDIINQLFDRFGMRAKDFSPGGRLLESGNLVKKYESNLPAIYELEMPQTSVALQEPTLSDANELQLPQTTAPKFKPSKISNLITSLTTSNQECRPKGQYFYVLDEKDVYPIASSVLEEYRYSNLKIKIDVAKALMVPEPQTQSASDVSQLIYFADWFPRMVYYSHSRKDKQWLSIEWIQQLTSQGCIGTCDSSLEGLLRTRRLLMEGAESAAVSSLLGISIIEKRSTIFPNTLNQLLLADIFTMMQTMPGEAFIDSFEEIGKTELGNSQSIEKNLVVDQIDLSAGTVELKDPATGDICKVDIRFWETQKLLPPLIGDKVAACFKRSRGGSSHVNGITVIEGIDTWRFGSSGLKGKVIREVNGNFLIKGNKELGKRTLILCKPINNIQLKIGDEVIFKLLRGYPSQKLKTPWSLVASNVVKAQSTPSI